MHLSHRPASLDDLSDCAKIIRGNRYYSPALVPQQTDFWRRLILDRSMLTMMIEDIDRQPGARLLMFSSTVFVTDEFAQAARCVVRPSAASLLHEWWLAGKEPELAPDRIGRANAGEGLNCFCNTYGFSDGITAEETAGSVELIFRRLFADHAGYRIKEFIAESYSDEHAMQHLKAGLLSRNNYGEFFAAHPEPVPPAGERPHLLGITREEASEWLGNRYLPLFLYTPPRFGFRPGEQALLYHALTGQTNSEIAATLHIAPTTVKKRWDSIYARAARVEPQLFSDHHPEKGALHRRGVEKKDKLLAYVRQHPEELRPYAW